MNIELVGERLVDQEERMTKCFRCMIEGAEAAQRCSVLSSKRLMNIDATAMIMYRFFGSEGNSRTEEGLHIDV